MKYINYKVVGNDFTYLDDKYNHYKIPLRINGKINKDALLVVNSIRNTIFLNSYKDVINEDMSKLYYNINNNILNDETSYYLAKLITNSVINKETINLSSLVEKNQKPFMDVEYLMEEIDNFRIIKDKNSINKNIELIKQYNAIKFYVEEYYLKLIDMKKRI